MRTNLRVRLGYQWEREVPMDGEDRRKAIYVQGVYMGDIVYVKRQHRAPEGSWSATGFVTNYGWRPAKAHPNAKLTNAVGAVERLKCPHGFPGPGWDCCRAA